jgi:hypothetical protein
MSTLKDKTIASTYDQLVKRADTYVQAGTNIEIMDDSGAVQATGLYLESNATTSYVGIGTSSPQEELQIQKDNGVASLSLNYHKSSGAMVLLLLIYSLEVLMII